MTEVPILLGGEATLELPARFLLQTQIGVVPGAYVDTVDSALFNAGAYNQATSEIVRSSLGGALVARFSAGVRPFRHLGLELMGGYTLTTFGGGVSTREGIQAFTGEPLPSDFPDVDIPIHSTVHSVHASIGWHWIVDHHLSVRASVSYLQAVASSSHVDLPAQLPPGTNVAMAEAALPMVNQIFDKQLNDIYTSYVKLPLFGLSVGYQF